MTAILQLATDLDPASLADGVILKWDAATRTFKSSGQTATTTTGTHTGPVRLPVAAVAATGTNLATAAQLAEGINVVSAADDTKAVKLPATPTAGTIVIVKSTVSNKILKVFPDAAATINAIAANAEISLASGPTPAIFIATSATQWYTLPLLPS